MWHKRGKNIFMSCILCVCGCGCGCVCVCDELDVHVAKRIPQNCMHSKMIKLWIKIAKKYGRKVEERRRRMWKKKMNCNSNVMSLDYCQTKMAIMTYLRLRIERVIQFIGRQRLRRNEIGSAYFLLFPNQIYSTLDWHCPLLKLMYGRFE